MVAVTVLQTDHAAVILRDDHRGRARARTGHTRRPVAGKAARIRPVARMLDVDEEAVRKLDFFEDLDSGHYLKTPVRVESEGHWLEAFCYSAGPALAPYASGDWSAQRVTEQDKQYFIQTLIPEMLAALANRPQ